MTKETIVEVPALTLWYYPDTRIIHHEVAKYPGAETLESALQKGLELIRNRGASKWLSDDRRSGALPKSHHEWALNVWGPDAAAAGWKYWAVVPPTEMIGTKNIGRLIEIYGSLGVKVQSFRDPKAAMDWLVSCR
jgi:hypothetical protein